MFSMRVSASRVVLAWMVDMLPSWPVFIACSMSNASAPRTSPMMMRSGRMRRALRTRSRWVTSPRPSRLGGRVSSRTTCGCCNCSSAASSTVTMRSPGSIRRDMAFISVVLPEPVPPEMMTFSRRCAAISSTRATGVVSAPNSISLAKSIALLAELADRDVRPVQRQRREHDVDARAVLQPRIHHRAGFVDAPADRGGDALADVGQMRRVAEPHVRQRHLAARVRRRSVRPVDHDVGDRLVVQQRLERPEAEHVVHQFLGQRALLARVELDAPLGRDLRDQPFHSAVSRSAGMAATAAGSSRARQSVAQFGDRFFRRRAGHVHVHVCRGFRLGGAAAGRSGDRRRAGAAAEGRDRRAHALRRNGCQLRRAPDRGAAGRRGRGGVEQADERHLARQLVHRRRAIAAVTKPSRARPGSRRCRPAAAGRE